MTETPPFDEGLLAFREFVRSNGFGVEVVWVFREDVTQQRRDYWVRLPVPPNNTELVRRYYESGREQKLGVTFEVLGRVEEVVACYIWVPRDEIDAEYAMQGPLKLAVPVARNSGHAIKSSIQWWVRRTINRIFGPIPFANRIPLRREVESILKIKHILEVQ